MELIKDKLLKIKTLAEKGVDGEAKAAQFQLEKLLKKYNLRIEDLFDETIRTRKFVVPKANLMLFLQILAANIGSRYKETWNYKGKPSVKYVEMSDQEYVDFEQQFSFYKQHFNKELKKQTEDLLHAFCYKHNLFNKDEEAVKRSEAGMSLEEYRRIMNMVDDLEDVTFRKQLKG